MSYDDFSLTGLSKYKVIFISGENAQGKSTLTSEAPFYTLFGSSLRYSKIAKLLSWYYVPDNKEESFSQLGLAFDMTDYTSNLTIKRTLVGDDKFTITIDNDVDNLFYNLSAITKIPDLNAEIKKLLDIDERKFSILYLKSPFSEVLFEGDSDLLSSITKSQYINELRKDFNDIINGLKLDITNLKTTIEKQNSLSDTITKQLQAIVDLDKQRDDREKLEQIVEELSQLEEQLQSINKTNNEVRAEYSNYSDKKNKGIEWTTRLKTQLQQSVKEREKYINLIKRGVCVTCEQPIANTLYKDIIEQLDEQIAQSTALLEKGQARLHEINDQLKLVDGNLTVIQDNQRNVNNKLRTLSTMKSQLQASLNNYKDNKSNNDEILKKIRTTILDLNDDLNLISGDYKILESVAKVMLSKNSEYINTFYNNKIHSFNLVYQSILSKMTKGKYTKVSINLNNKPTLNGHIEYEALSTSERKFIDISFVISYIVYLSIKLNLKTFILDEFLDNYDKKNILHIYHTIYEIAHQYDLQLIVTTNMADYLFNYMGDMEDIKVIQLEK